MLVGVPPLEILGLEELGIVANEVAPEHLFVKVDAAGVELGVLGDDYVVFFDELVDFIFVDLGFGCLVLVVLLLLGSAHQVVVVNVCYSLFLVEEIR